MTDRTSILTPEQHEAFWRMASLPTEGYSLSTARTSLRLAERHVFGPARRRLQWAPRPLGLRIDIDDKQAVWDVLDEIDD